MAQRVSHGPAGKPIKNKSHKQNNTIQHNTMNLNTTPQCIITYHNTYNTSYRIVRLLNSRTHPIYVTSHLTHLLNINTTCLPNYSHPLLNTTTTHLFNTTMTHPLNYHYPLLNYHYPLLNTAPTKTKRKKRLRICTINTYRTTPRCKCAYQRHLWRGTHLLNTPTHPHVMHQNTHTPRDNSPL